MGGLVMKEFGHLPSRGEVVQMGELRFEVLNADTRRLRLMRVSPIGCRSGCPDRRGPAPRWLAPFN